MTALVFMDTETTGLSLDDDIWEFAAIRREEDGAEETTHLFLQRVGVADEIGLPWKSDDLSRACGVEPPTEDERHTALGDARWVMRLYDAITGL